MASLHAAAKDRRLGAVVLIRTEAALIGLLCFAAGAVPRLLPTLLGLLAVCAAIHVFAVDPARPLRLLRSAIGIALAVFTVYLFIDATWSPDRAEAFTKAATVLGLVAAVVLIAASCSLRDASEARMLAKSALAGLAIGMAFLLIELNFGEPIVRFLNNHVVHLFEVTPKKTKVVEGEVTKLSAYVLNRNVTSLVLLLIPSLLFTGALDTTNSRRFSLVALIAATAAIVLLSESGTSVVAFFVGALVLALAALSLKVTRMLLAVGWTVATLLAVPLGALPYELGWHKWSWLPPESVAARFYIWKYVADEVHKRPVTGIGIRGTRTLHLVIPADAGDPNNSGFALEGRAARHPHNIYLQTWLELGGIGAVLLLMVGLAGLWQMRLLSPLLQGASYGLFAIFGAIGLSGFDLWQTWLLAAVAFAWAAIQLAARLPALFLAADAHACGGAGRKAALPATRA